MSGAQGGPGGDAPSLSPELLRFNYQPTAYMHPSWWQTNWLPADLFERLRQNPRSQRHLSGFFLRQAGLADRMVLDCDPVHSRLALIPGPRLNRLALLAGLTLLSPSIARVLRSADKALIKEGLGERDYEFAIRRGRLLLQQARLTDTAGDIGLRAPAEAMAEARQLGIASLATALQDAAEPLLRRTRWKLPRGAAEQYWRPLMSRSQEFLRLFRLLDRQVLAR